MGHHRCRPPVITDSTEGGRHPALVTSGPSRSGLYQCMEPCMSTSTCDRSANIWPNILKLHMHEYVGAAVGGSLLEGRRKATPLCPGLGPAWPKCDGLS